MSTSESPSTLPLSDVASPLDSLADALGTFVSFVAFWVGTLLPLSYVPLLAGGVLSTRPLAFGALLLVNIVAMVLGHSHKRPA
ncbi:hypothetical protein [Halorarius litoreus]|uniref:hypothetical protein n=1 Tax=Halorarius litoreus TaxID=2962676 RepID=UPI0020CCE4D8|nr:hypothetical protein [Halorarius litoreus]